MISLRHNLHRFNYSERITSAPRNLDRRIEDNTRNLTTVCQPYVKGLAERIQKICSLYGLAIGICLQTVICFQVIFSKKKLSLKKTILNTNNLYLYGIKNSYQIEITFQRKYLIWLIGAVVVFYDISNFAGH